MTMELVTLSTRACRQFVDRRDNGRIFCVCGGEFRGKKKHQDHETMGNGASDSCCGLWVVDDRKNIERADRLHKSELYACRAWVPYVRHVERLLKKKRVAPFERGVCFLSPPGFVECPICFLVWKDTITATLTTTPHPACRQCQTHACFCPQSYRNINRTCCCDQPICTGLRTYKQTRARPVTFHPCALWGDRVCAADRAEPEPHQELPLPLLPTGGVPCPVGVRAVPQGRGRDHHLHHAHTSCPLLHQHLRHTTPSSFPFPVCT